MKTAILCVTSGKSQARFANFHLVEEEGQGWGYLGRQILENARGDPWSQHRHGGRKGSIRKSLVPPGKRKVTGERTPNASEIN